MWLLSYLSSFLLASKFVLPSDPSTTNFTLQVWLDNFPLNHQYISWFPIPDKPGRGYFGIPIRSPAEPLPVADRAIFTINSSYPGSLFFSSPQLGDQSNFVFVQQSGEVEYGAEIPVEFFEPYTGNFTTVDFKTWPDLETVHALDFTPPELVLGMFLACPRELGDGKEKGYRLMAMTRMFKHPGCITLDWLVQEGIKKEGLETGGSDTVQEL